MAGGEEGDHRLQVVVAADGQGEVDLRLDARLEERRHRRPGGIGNRRHAKRPSPVAQAGEVEAGIGDGAGVPGTYLEVAQSGKVGDQHLEAGPRQGVGEGDQPGVVLALARHPGHQHHGGACRRGGRVEVAVPLPFLDGVGHGPAIRRRRLRLERARPPPGVDVGEHLGRLVEAGRRAAGGEDQRPGAKMAKEARTHLDPRQSKQARRAPPTTGIPAGTGGCSFRVPCRSRSTGPRSWRTTPPRVG